MSSHLKKGFENDLVVGFLPAIAGKLARERNPFSVIACGSTQHAEKREFECGNFFESIFARHEGARIARRYCSRSAHGHEMAGRRAGIRMAVVEGFQNETSAAGTIRQLFSCRKSAREQTNHLGKSRVAL
jgi:hypothetical protein